MKPFTPQPLEVLKERFIQATKSRHSVKAIIEDISLRPSNKEQHIFDFQDGIRLIVSRDYYEATEIIHFSASVDLRLFKPKRKPTVPELLDIMVGHFCSISGYKEDQVKFIKFSEGQMVPHWYVPFQILN